MKRLTPQQIQNILFTVIVALAAFSVYLLTGQNGRWTLRQDATPTPAVTEAPAQEPEFESVPGPIFSMILTNGDKALAKADKDEPETLHMQYGAVKTGRAKLLYTLDGDGRVSSFTITFPVLEEPEETPKPSKNKQADWEKKRASLTAEQDEKQVAAQNEAIREILCAAIDACDLNGALIRPVALRWYSGALEARDGKKTFEDAYCGCAFQAYRMQDGADEVLVCSLIIGK